MNPERDPRGPRTASDAKDTIVLNAGDTAPAADAAPPQEPRPAGDRYRIVARHKRGGLGEVFVAEDAELHRRVALKEIREAHADDPESRLRFVREAEVTGALEHPGIVPVYGLGAHANGRPFYAMRFVEGETLRDALRRFHETPRFHSLAFRALLQRFVAVCNAVAYAHSRGVLHRDLKPNNVMLGPYGETLVVDWGLAKRLDGEPAGVSPRCEVSDASHRGLTPAGSPSATAAGQALGTPAYMSPEQAAGQTDDLGPASDVYSLGATLYELLTGRAAFAGTLDEVFDAITTGRFEKPRAVVAAVPPALEAVCLKAMATRPADRHASALDLAKDVERWLADEPVPAYREPASVRVGRWVRRHRTGVAVAATALVLAATGLGALAVVQARANRDLDAAFVRVRDTNAALDESLRRERSARGAAERHFGQARQAVDEMLTQVGGSQLANVPQADGVRRQLMERALALYESFAAERPDDPTLRAEVARALNRAADHRFRLGNVRESDDGYRRAVAALRELVAASPDDALLRRELGQALIGRAWLHYMQGQGRDCEATGREAIAELARAGDEPVTRRYLALAWSNLSLLFRDRGDWTQAEAAMREALTIREQMAATAPTNPERKLDVSASLNNLGNLFGAQEEFVKAVEYHERARAIRAELHAANPQAENIAAELARSEDNLAQNFKVLHRYAEALPAHDRALVLQRKLVGEHPARADYAADLGRMCQSLGDTLRMAGRPRDGLPLFAEAETILTGLLARDAKNGRARIYLSSCQWGWAVALHKAGEYRDCLPRIDKAIALAPKSRLPELRLMRVGCRAKLGDHASAAAEAAELAKEVSPAEPRAFARFADIGCAFGLCYAASPEESYATAALGHLRRAAELARGPAAAELAKQLLTDADLDALRRRDDFADLLWELADAPSGK